MYYGLRVGHLIGIGLARVKLGGSGSGVSCRRARDRVWGLVNTVEAELRAWVWVSGAGCRCREHDKRSTHGAKERDRVQAGCVHA